MDIFIKANPNSKMESVRKIDASHFEISVKEPPVRERANKAVILALANYLDVSSSKLKIVRGLTSRKKVIVLERNMLE